MNEVKRIFLIRHGETDYVLNRKYCGWSDIPLNANGLRQAALLRKRMKALRPDAVYCSDLLRARQMAEAVFPKFKGGLIVSNLLRELKFGKWEGLTHDEIAARFPEIHHKWHKDPTRNAPPGGESLVKMAARLERAIRMIMANKDCETAAVVAHGGVVKVLLCKAIGAALSSFWNVASDAAGLSIIDYYKGGAIVRVANDTSHLGGFEKRSGSVYNPVAVSVRKKL